MSTWINRTCFISVLSLCVFVWPSEVFALAGTQNKTKDIDGFKIIKSRAVIENEAWKLIKSGQFSEAMVLYQKSLEPQYWEYEWQQAVARGGIVKILKYQHEYDAALEALEWQLKFNLEKFEPWRQEILALKKFHNTADSTLVYTHVAFLMEKYRKIIPPVANGATGIVAQILRLYDTIGDHDAGIAYIDMCLDYFKTATEAKGEVFVLGGFHNEYLKIREAFEKDKAESTKGRATKALIQSDYFPW